MSNLTNNWAWSELKRTKGTKMTYIEQKEIPYNIIFLFGLQFFNCLRENTQRDIKHFAIIQ